MNRQPMTAAKPRRRQSEKKRFVARVGGMLVACAAAIAWMAPSPGLADEISVTQYKTSFYGAPYTIALAKGYFKKAGIDITGIIGSGGGGTTVRNILASPTPYGEVAIGAALAAAAQGIDIVFVNTGARTVAESSLVALPGSDVKSLEDLVGKKVAITNPRSMTEMILLLELKSKNIDASKIQRVASGGYLNSITMLKEGAVSAAAMVEPLSIIRAHDFKTVVAAKNILPAMTTSVGITTRAFAKAHPDKIKAIIAGRREGVKAIYANPKDAAAIIAKDYKLDPAVADTAVENMIGPRMWSEGGFSKDELDRAIEGLRLIGEVKGDVDLSKLIDQSYLPDDLKSKL